MAFPLPLAVVLFSGSIALAACAAPDSDGPAPSAAGDPQEGAAPRIQALNAFYYYADVDRAWRFYTDVLGFETAADFGFAKIMRVGPSSYLTVVDAERGMHSVDEPKSVTLAIVTEQVEGWYDYLRERGVSMRSELGTTEGRPHDGFVAVDPEGYLLEFERFNEHPENRDLTPILAASRDLHSESGARPAELGVEGTVLWLYYEQLPPVERFYERLLGAELLVDQGWAKVYQAAPTGFVGLVDGSRGLHQASEMSAVTVSFFTEDVEGWLARARALGVELRSDEIGDESGRVRTLVGYDPAGYFLEWDTFLPVEGNARLLAELGGA